jgi:hypothetical protein
MRKSTPLIDYLIARSQWATCTGSPSPAGTPIERARRYANRSGVLCPQARSSRIVERPPRRRERRRHIAETLLFRVARLRGVRCLNWTDSPWLRRKTRRLRRGKAELETLPLPSPVIHFPEKRVAADSGLRVDHTAIRRLPERFPVAAWKGNRLEEHWPNVDQRRVCNRG